MIKNVKDLFADLLMSTEVRKVDYKRDQYLLDNDLLKSKYVKDILCIANVPGDDGYILLGVKSERGTSREVVGIGNHHDSATLESIVNGVIEEPIQFEYYPLNHAGKDCALLYIPSSRSRPHWPKRNYGVLKKHIFYTRRASGNREASFTEIREMFLSAIRISEIAQQKAISSGHIADELRDMSLDDRKIAMYKIFKGMASKLHLTNYYPLTATYITGQAGALVTNKTEEAVNDYCIVMYPWTANRDDIIWTRQRIKMLIEGSRSKKLRSPIKMRLMGSTLVHICYRNINTRALQARYYNDSQNFYIFANEWNEQWGKVIKWEANIPEVHAKRVRNKQHYLTSYKKKAKYELFLTNVSSKDELKDRIAKLLFWVSSNPI